MSIDVRVEDGTRLHVLTEGIDGPERPVLLVHGLASNAHLWDGVAARLAATGHPVAAVDQRGHGRSDKPDHGYDFATLTEDLLAVLAHLGWSDASPIVAGQSWGGNVVLELAARHPAAVGRLVLVDGGTINLSARFADWPTCEVAMTPPALAGTPAATIERLFRGQHPDWPEEGIQGSLANFEVLADGTVRPWLSLIHHLAILRGLWEHQPGASYPRVEAPVLMVMAEDPSNQRWMAGKRAEVNDALKHLGSARVEWVDGDHDLHAEFPALVADLIRFPE